MAETGPTCKQFQPKDSLDHAWAWFQVHASQRMQLINYFLVAVAFLIAAFAAGLEADKPLVSAAICLFGVVISSCFRRIEARTRELIRHGEDALREIELHMRMDSGIHGIRLIEKASSPRDPSTSYGAVIRTLHRWTIGLFLTGMVYSLALAIW